MNFDQAFDLLIGNEGGYSFNAADPGGETMWGVTARIARASGYVGEMRDLPRETAKAIYRAKYWTPLQADQMPDALKFHLFDAAVNSGVQQAIKWLQRSMDVGDDGILGPLTLAAALRANGQRLATRFTAERLDFMTSLPTWGNFGKGWARRIAGNLKQLAGA